MFSIYLSCLVLGGSFTVLSAFGQVRDRRASGLGKNGPIYTLRSLVYSLAGFGGAGVLMSNIDTGFGQGMEMTFAILSGLLVGGAVSAGIAFLARSSAGEGPSSEVT